MDQMNNCNHNHNDSHSDNHSDNNDNIKIYLKKNRNNNKIEIIRKLITKNNRSYKRKHWNEEEN